MESYYDILEVTNKADNNQIKKAYYKRARKTHPDKLGNEDEFKKVNEAYEILGEPSKRAKYDFEQFVDGMKIERCYCLHSMSSCLNHYDFINFLLVLDESNKSVLPGESISADICSRLNDIRNLIDEEHQALLKEKNSNRYFDKKRISLLSSTLKQIKKVQSDLAIDDSARKETKILYDLLLKPKLQEVYFTDEMRDIETVVGGGKPLWEDFCNYCYYLAAAGSIVALYRVGLLNPVNIKNLFQIHQAADSVSTIILNLEQHDLLTQENFDLLMRNKEHISSISDSMNYLSKAEKKEKTVLLDQRIFKELMDNGRAAARIGYHIYRFHKYKLLNDTNLQMVVELAKASGILFEDFFIGMRKKGFFPQEKIDALHWTGKTDGLQKLSLHIDEMFAYGIYLLNEDRDDPGKGEAAMLLALDLKLELKTFYDNLNNEERGETEQKNFNSKFFALLDSKNNVMGKHRAEWVVYVKNIMLFATLALTGKGLVAAGAAGIYCMYTGHLFFNRTNREKMRDIVIEDASLVGICRPAEI